MAMSVNGRTAWPLFPAPHPSSSGSSSSRHPVLPPSDRAACQAGDSVRVSTPAVPAVSLRSSSTRGLPEIRLTKHDPFVRVDPRRGGQESSASGVPKVPGKDPYSGVAPAATSRLSFHGETVMRPVLSRRRSPRSGTLSSVGLLLAVALAIAIECQQLARTAESLDPSSSAAASRPTAPVSAGRPDPMPERGHALSNGLPSPSALPAWKPGFEWHYRWSDQRGSGTYTRTIVAVDAVDGLPCYVMRTGNREIYWSTADLAWVMERMDGKIESRALPEYRRFVWPLEPGKTWMARYQWSHPGEGKTEERARRHRVAGFESVRVPAGTYQAVRVVVTDAAANKISEYWYAPDARWLVKEKLYTPGGVRDRELIYASLWPKASPH